MTVAQLRPKNVMAIVFSVPCPLESRQDICVIEAGALHMDIMWLDHLCLFTNKLKAYEIFACHAVSTVAAFWLEQHEHKFSRIDEVSPVYPNKIDSELIDAKKLGF